MNATAPATGRFVFVGPSWKRTLPTTLRGEASASVRVAETVASAASVRSVSAGVRETAKSAACTVTLPAGTPVKVALPRLSESFAAMKLPFEYTTTFAPGDGTGG